MRTIFNGLKRLNSCQHDLSPNCTFILLSVLIQTILCFLSWFSPENVLTKKKCHLLGLTCCYFQNLLMHFISESLNFYRRVPETKIFDLRCFWQEAVQILNQSLEACKIKGIKSLGWQWKHMSAFITHFQWAQQVESMQCGEPADNSTQTNRWQNIDLRLGCLWFTCSSPTSQCFRRVSAEREAGLKQNKMSDEWLLPCDFLTMFMFVSSLLVTNTVPLWKPGVSASICIGKEETNWNIIFYLGSFPAALLTLNSSLCVEKWAWDLPSYLVLDRKCISIKVINLTDNIAGLSQDFFICYKVIWGLITARLLLVMAGFALYSRLVVWSLGVGPINLSKDILYS